MGWAWLERLRRRPRLPVWYHEAYRLPLHDGRETLGIEPRRADLALWALHATPRRSRLAVHEATRASYAQLARVHTPAHLEALTQAHSLARIFGLDREDFPVDAVLATIRLATGGTIAATRWVVGHGGAAVNLLGGFHHAFPDRGGGLCPVNDLAVALACARADGFEGRVVILDLDAHPPDGTAACTANDPGVWIGSISGSDWGPLPPHVDETVIEAADDTTYLATLDALLSRAPPADLVMVVAGGDVLAHDRMGLLAMSEAGARARDEAVRRWIGDRPSVWVPGGGYQARAWRVLAGTVDALLDGRFPPLPIDLDPVGARFSYVSRSLDPRDLRGGTGEDTEALLTQDELDTMFGAPSARPVRLLDFYTEEGIEYALHAFGILSTIRRLGYRRFVVTVTRTPTGDRAQLTGEADGQRHLLWETVLGIETWRGHRLLVLEWMTMRHPLGHFGDDHPRLPGQEVPGLGLAEEAVQLLVRVTERLHLDGILLRPAWLHTAAMSRGAFRFEDPAAQGTFDALMRDLGHLPLTELSAAVAAGRARRNGEPWAWAPAEMVAWRVEPPPWDEAVRDATREATRFELAPDGVP